MDERRILSLLGLALRGGNLQAGEEAVGDAIASHAARLVLIAADAAENSRRAAEQSAGREDVPCLTVPFSKADLGQALGRAAAAQAALTDAGLAAAVVRRLSEEDPEKYREILSLLEKRERRAAERRAARKAREKDRERRPLRRKKPGPVREGQRTPKKPRPQPEGGGFRTEGKRSGEGGRGVGENARRRGGRPGGKSTARGRPDRKDAKRRTR